MRENIGFLAHHNLSNLLKLLKQNGQVLTAYRSTKPSRENLRAFSLHMKSI